jgi:hypothetical protein
MEAGHHVGGVTIGLAFIFEEWWASGRGHGVEVQTVRADTLVVEANVVWMSDGHTKLADRRGNRSAKAQVRGMRPR